MGFLFEVVNGPPLMRRATRSSSFPSCQALKKSACMVDPGRSPSWSEESFTVPRPPSHRCSGAASTDPRPGLRLAPRWRSQGGG